MKQIFYILLLTISFSVVSCKNTDNDKNKKLEVKENSVYKLFPTENIWTFLKLDTRNGRIWQIQYSINEDNPRLEVDLSTKRLVSSEKEENGRFTLYPTKNMYNFILLDQINGDTWQVQWAIEEDNRLIIPIK